MRQLMRLATIPPGAPFLETLVDACLDGSLGITLDRSSRDFSQALIYVPTRRAARALAHAFASKLQPRAVLLPRIVPLGDPSDIEQEAALLAGSGTGLEADLPPAIPTLRRLLMLTRFVEAWRGGEGYRELAARGDGFTIGESFADSFALAGDLARVIDEAIIEGADWSRLRTLVEGPFDEYFRQTRTFLEIAAQAWPLELERLGLLDESDRLNRLLAAETERLRRHTPQHPVIAAGSTGTMPATAALLAAIAGLPQGAVVLPGLDLDMPVADWELVAEDEAAEGQPGHPQGALKRLLGRFGAAREHVISLGQPEAGLSARAAAVSAASRPADATDGWLGLRDSLEPELDGALAGLTVIEASDEREEALAIAIALREVLETPGRTAALVTPDRALADRVAGELRRWGVDADDSAGRPLDTAPLGILAGLILHALQEDFAPAPILALLASPCIRWESEHDIALARTALELLAFRGVTVRPGISGLAMALDDAEERLTDKRAHPAVKRLPTQALPAAQALLAFVIEVLKPFAEAVRSGLIVSDLAGLHGETLQRLAGVRATEGADGQALARLFDRLVSEGADMRLTLSDYAAIFASEAKSAVVQTEAPPQGRIRIWGLLEARLLSADRIVLGGLNEGSWPAAPRQDALLNRIMRTTLGLPLPERRIGQAAHDFAQAMGAPEVVIARAMTVEGEPRVASRFLRRFDAFVGETRTKIMRQRGQQYLVNARAMDADFAAAAVPRPDPRPDPALQPLSLSVTDVRTLHRDPYAIYARDVLGLRPLDDLDPPPDARDRGNIIHEALADFVKEIAGGWPADPLERLIEIGRKKFDDYGGDENVQAFWWPTFQTAAAWVIANMEGRRASVVESYPETDGRLAVPLRDGAALSLRGRGDLFERMADGTLSVTDYKTGQPPSNPQVVTGIEPQLTLMAAMAMQGAFDRIAKAEVSQIRYLKLGRENDERVVTFKNGDTVTDAARRHLAELQSMMSDLRERKRAYIPRRRPKLSSDFGDYDHLARVSEWLAAGADEEEPSQK